MANDQIHPSGNYIQRFLIVIRFSSFESNWLLCIRKVNFLQKVLFKKWISMDSIHIYENQFKTNSNPLLFEQGVSFLRV